MFKLRGKSLTLFLLGVLVGVPFVSSCLRTETRSDPNLLRICTQSWIPQKFKLVEVADQFMKENPKVKIVIEQFDSQATYSWHPLSVEANRKKYDIFIGSSREHIVSYVSMGLIDSFETGFFDDKFRKDDFFPSFLELGNIGGKQYMIPLMGELMMIVVRKDLFRKRGLVNQSGQPIPAKTWEDLDNYVRKLTSAGEKGEKTYGINIDFGKNMMVYSFYSALQARKGSIFNDRTLYIDTSSEDVHYLLTKWRQLVREDLAPTYTFEDPDAGREQFKAGKVVMLLAPHSRWVECAGVLGEDKVGIIPLPGAGHNGSLTYIHGIVLSKNASNRALAIRFIKEKLLSRDFQAWSMKKYGKIPSLIRNYNPALSTEWKEIFSAVRDSTTLPLYKDWAEFDRVLQLEIRNCVLNKQSVSGTITKLTEQLNKIDKSTGLEL